MPVYNEAGELVLRLRQLRAELDAVTGPWVSPVHIVVADNGSTDGTGALARTLLDELAPMRVLDVSLRGKGAAVTAAWRSSSADIVAYTDLDQSAPISQLPLLLAHLEHSDLVVGNRYMAGGVAVRTWRRRLTRVVPSHVYRVLMRVVLPVPVTDVNCGFKAATAAAIAPVLSQVQSTGWFFDTELATLAAVSGLSVTSQPVRWVDDPESRVRVIKVAREMLTDMLALRRRLRTAC